MAEPNRRERKKPLRIAVVDDHRMMLDGILAHLRAHRTGIEVAISEPTWLGLISHEEFPVDVVVLDLNLNDTIPIVTKIRALTAAGCRTVVISRHADSGTIQGALAAGALAFVPKTETVDELLAAVRAVAVGSRHLSPHASTTLGRFPPNLDPGIGAQEQRAMAIYASGRSIREVAAEMGTTEETVKSYIKRARRKYREVDIDVGTKILLRRRGIEEGWLIPE